MTDLYTFFRSSVVLALHQESLLACVRPTVEHLRSHGLTIVAVDHYPPMLAGIMGTQGGCFCVRTQSGECDVLIDFRQIRIIAAQCRLTEQQVLEAAIAHEAGHALLFEICPETNSEQNAWHFANIARQRFPGIVSNKEVFQVVQSYCLTRSSRP